MPEFLFIAPALILVLVLLVSAAAKLRAPLSTQSAFKQLRLGRLAAKPWPTLLPWAEIALALALLLAPAWVAIPVAVAALALFVAYYIVIARALRFEVPVTCGCFGELGMGAVTARTARRNAVLVLLAVAHLAWTARGGSVLGAVLDQPAASLVLALIILATSMLTWLIVAPETQSGPLRTRQAAPNSSPEAVRAAQALAAQNAAAASLSAQADDDPEAYVRTPIPNAVLINDDGHAHNVRALANGQARLLLFLSFSCTACEEVMSQIEPWAVANREVEPVLIFDEIYAVGAARDEWIAANPDKRVKPGQHFAPKYGAVPNAVPGFPLWFDRDRLAALTFEIGATPSAVLLGADGLLAGGPITGSGSILTFMEEIAEQLAAARS